LDAYFQCASHAFTLEFKHTSKQISRELLEFPYYSGKAAPQCQATPIEFGSPHEAICEGFVDIFYQFFIPTDFRA
jgi:hypothetical protein